MIILLLKLKLLIKLKFFFISSTIIKLSFQLKFLFHYIIKLCSLQFQK